MRTRTEGVVSGHDERRAKRGAIAWWAAASAAIVLLVTTSSAVGQTKFVPAGAPAEAAFGSAAAVQGSFAVVGAPREVDAAGRQAGAVYVSSLDGSSSWRLTPSDADTRFQFGRAVAVDGDAIVVGAVFAAYVFRFDGTNWNEEAKLGGSCADGRFGTSVAIEGSRLMVGAPLKGCLDASVEGHVFFYHRTGAGVWELTRKLTSHYGTVGSYYGWSVSLDGSTAVVGAPGWGEVFTYWPDGSTWQIGERIVDPIWGSGRSFGRSVSLQDGALVVGTPGDSEVQAGAGAAYVYRQAASGGWASEGKLLPPPTSPAQKLTGSYYGSTVGLSGDLIVMGGPQADIAGQENGAVLVFARQNGSWAYQATLTAADGGSYDYLGTGLDIDHGFVLAGAPGHDALGANVGAAYLYAVGAAEPPPPPDDPPPANEPPVASFTYECIELTCHFDGSGSYDPDGTVAVYSWQFGDGSTGNGVTAAHTYAFSGTYTVRLTVTDDKGIMGSTTRTVTASGDSDIVLSATGYKLQGLQKARLTWFGTAAASVDVYRNAVIGATVANTGSYTDHINLRGRGTYTYRICEAGTTKCSNEVTVVFN